MHTKVYYVLYKRIVVNNKINWFSVVERPAPMSVVGVTWTPRSKAFLIKYINAYFDIF